MALVTVCDKCNKILDDRTDEVVIEYRYLRTPNSPIRSHETVNLCADCYKEIFGDQLEVIKKGGNIWEEK